jgi:coproporphyrinogen III oxidase
MNHTKSVRDYLLTLQNKISAKIQEQEAISFQADKWDRPDGGGGESRILEGGATFEKAGINFSDVQGDHLPKSATNSRPHLEGAQFRAMGISLVLHPRNPFVPTTHMNVRFFSAKAKTKDTVWWFGGGYDLTPYYGFDEDAVHWHQTAKAACDPFGENLYKTFKENCDRYFFLPHRNEPRGIGGLFFDDYNRIDFEHSFALTQSIGDSFLEAYMPILEKRKTHAYSDKNRVFQSYRRGRYVEFNLLYDRGTLFGLQSKGRTESILMSLPPSVHWKYDYKPESHTQEAELYERFLINKDWIN